MYAPFAGLAIATAGAVVSTRKLVVGVVALLPYASVWVALTRYTPSASGAVMTDHDPSAPTGAVSEPRSSDTVAASPGAVPAVPAIAGVASLVTEPSAGVVSAGAGAVVSTVNV